MIVILNNKTHVGANPPSDTTKTWISADMTEISIYPEPETYDKLNERIDVKAILLEHNLDIKSDRIRVFSLADDVLEVKRYVNGEWIVVDNPGNYVDIIMNGKVIGTMEVDSIVPGEEVEEWDGNGVVIEEIVTEDDSIVGTWAFNDLLDIITFADNNSYFEVDFTSNGNTFSFIRYRTAIVKHIMDYGSVQVYVEKGEKPTWTDIAYKTINIISEPTDKTFITWLKANAVKQ